MGWAAVFPVGPVAEVERPDFIVPFVPNGEDNAVREDGVEEVVIGVEFEVVVAAEFFRVGGEVPIVR